MSTPYDAQELAELDAHDERRHEARMDAEPRRVGMSCRDRMCGAEDCPRCHPTTWRECGGEDEP